ncbi:MAG: cobyric acid synthase [Magnetovibrio sp.]|nr:cobyric acid synthase [Magnetovibrio sp.]
MPSAPDRAFRALMVQGTGSDVGKSMLVAGLIRAYADRGLKVAPFKPQNMSNNAAVTPDGGEIGRAQALQARAARLPLSVDMNPVLLKPQTDVGAQVVVRGRVEGNAQARDYHDLKPKLMPRVLESFDAVGAGRDLVVVEGAGSPAEVNLRAGDIANMGFAEAADVPVVLVGDIDRGGVIASIVGTFQLLSESEAARTRGFIVNKLRGDPTLFDDGVAILEDRTGRPCFGVVPYFADARRLPQEDAMALDYRERADAAGSVKIAVLRLGRIANFDDLDPLAAEADVDLQIIEPGSPVPGDADCVLIPGSKATLADLKQIRAEGWDIDIQAHARRGGWVVGICGGYQVLGRAVADPDGIEGAPGAAEGLGLLDVETVLGGDKALVERTGTELASGEAVTGYEMHIGDTDGPDRRRPWLRLADGRGDGAVSADGRIMGGYLHGVFAADAFRRAFLARLGGRAGNLVYEDQVERALDDLARHLAAHLDLDALLAAAG